MLISVVITGKFDATRAFKPMATTHAVVLLDDPSDGMAPFHLDFENLPKVRDFAAAR